MEELTTKCEVDFVKKLGKAVWDVYTGEFLELGIKFLDLEIDSQKIIKSFMVSQYLKGYGKDTGKK